MLKKATMTPAVNIGCRLTIEPRSPSANAAKTGTNKNGTDERNVKPLLTGHDCETRMMLAAIRADSETPKISDAAATATLASDGMEGVTGCRFERCPSESARSGTFINEN